MPLSYDVRFLDERALQAILELQEQVARSLPSPEIFRLHDEDYFRRLLGSDRFVIGVMVEDNLIAYSLITVPGKGNENLGRDIGLPAEELEFVAHLQATAVHPGHRGNGLQRKMGIAHLKVIEDMGFEHVLCTVSPKNPASLGNILSIGFAIVALKPKFGSAWRYIMYKNLIRPAAKRCCQAIIKGSDISGQLELLDKGYVGFGIKKPFSDFEVYYG